MFHYSAEASKIRKKYACIFLSEKRIAEISSVDCVKVPINDIIRVIESTIYIFGSNDVEDNNMIERED